MQNNLFRDLHLFVDGAEIAQGCHLCLSAEQALTLRPALHSLEIYDLSDASAGMLSGGRSLEVRSGVSILAFGEMEEVYTRRTAGKRQTSLVFSPGLSLWRASVSLSVAAGLSVSRTLQALLSACGAGIPLAAFAAPDPLFTRPQAFFGRVCEAMETLGEAAGADVFLTPAGVCVSGREGPGTEPAWTEIPESALLSPPNRAGDRLILSTSMVGWVLGTWVRVSWKGATWRGRIVSSLVQADNASGPWKTELEIELHE